MVTTVSPRLMNLAGLPGLDEEPHIRTGNHLRVGHNPVLGLPVAPFVVQRTSIRQGLPDNFAPRRDVVFRDASDRILTLPITVQKGDVIRATIIAGPALQCIWVGMVTTAIKKPSDTVFPPVLTHIDPRVVTRVNSRLSPRLTTLTRTAVVQPVVTPEPAPKRVLDLLGDRVVLHPPALNVPPSRNLPPRVNVPSRGDTTVPPQEKGGDLRMQVYGPSIGKGATLLGERLEAPYTFGAPSITEVQITGRGVITELAWLAAQDLEKLKWETIDVLHLPHKEGRRYLSVTDPQKRSEDKMRGQAPKRRPLQETIGAIAPDTAPIFTDSEESDRVHTLSAPLDNDLDVLIDGSDLPLQAAETIAVTDSAGNPLASDPGDESSISISHLGRVLQATLDPGVAAWLGFKGLDEEGVKLGLSFYRVVGFFRNPLAIGVKPEQLIGLPFGTIPANERQMSAPDVFRAVESMAGALLANEGRQLIGKLEDAGDYMMMAAVAAVDSRAIPAPPPPPTLLQPTHVSWLPAVPPAAVREVDCPVSDILVGATLAAEREQPIPGGYAQLNRLVSGGPWHSPLTLGLTTANDGELLGEQEPRQGVIADRQAGPDIARYHLAQQDRFGRWSSFAGRDAAAGPRPKPPRPVVQGSYFMPSIADAAVTGGLFRLRVPLPEVESLAPGSYPLSRVRLSFQHQNIEPPIVGVPMPDITASATTAIDIDVPPPGEAARRAVPAEMTGPILAPTEQRRMVITAVWVDTNGQTSALSEPLRLAMTDPRPPAQIAIPDVLLYSSRPDATGLAWVERAWSVPASNPPKYAAYYTDEVRLLSWLQGEGRIAEANDIAGTTDRAAKAGKFRAIQSQFPDYLFERLPGVIDDSTAGQRRLRHAVSGASRVLNAYKIAVEAPASGARPVLSGLDMVFYGVPNSDPPPRPVVTVKPVAPAAGEPLLVTEVTVTVEPGITKGTTARIYRTRGGVADPLYAPVIATLPLSAPDPVTGRQTVVLRDLGAADIAPSARLSAFSNYKWFAEVQGGPESGSSVPGLWSRHSDPAGLATIPLTAPGVAVFDGFEGVAVAGGTQDLSLKLSHPLGLQPTPVGAWKVEVLRAAPGEDWSRMLSGDILETPVVITDTTVGGFTPLATQYRITLYDPVGRPSPSLDVTTS